MTKHNREEDGSILVCGDGYVMKQPVWACGKCGKASNWLARVKCTRGRDAPKSIMDKAKKMVKLHDEKSNSDRAKAPRKKEQDGKPRSLPKEGQKLITAMQKELDTLKKAIEANKQR